MLSGSFRKYLPLTLMILACASSGERQQSLDIPKATSSILNIRQSGSVGPDIGTFGKLIEPASIMVNNLGDIFISDRATSAIYKLSFDMTPVAREGGLGGYGGGFNRPLGMAADAALNIYVADGGNRQIQLLDRNMRFVKSIASYEDENGESNEFVFPSDIAIDNEGFIWVADDDKVLKLDPFYRLLFEASQKGAGYFLLGRVSSIEISKNGKVAIADAGNNRVVLMSVYGNYIGEITTGPISVVTWDGNENLWALETGNGRISCYNIAGDPLFMYADTGGSRLVWLSFDREGRLLALDGNQRRLKIFEIIRGADTPANK